VGKILFWVVILVVAYVVWHMMVASKRRVDRSREAAGRDGPDAGQGAANDGRGSKAGRLRAPEAMMQCAVCGVHLPGSEAVYAQGRVYCSAEHRDQDETARQSPIGRPGP
jgi:uncharacterized protein